MKLGRTAENGGKTSDICYHTVYAYSEQLRDANLMGEVAIKNGGIINAFTLELGTKKEA
jgi:hypothetical protein